MIGKRPLDLAMLTSWRLDNSFGGIEGIIGLRTKELEPVYTTHIIRRFAIN